MDGRYNTGYSSQDSGGYNSSGTPANSGYYAQPSAPSGGYQPTPSTTQTTFSFFPPQPQLSRYHRQYHSYPDEVECCRII